MECQICFETDGVDGSTGTSMIMQLCGQREPKPHIDISNEDTKTLTLGRYETLCKKACSFQAPCCHKVDYAHLRCEDISRITAIDRVGIDVAPKVAGNEPESAPPSSDEIDGSNESDSMKIPEALIALYREFCFHRVDSRSVIQSVLEMCEKRDAADKTAGGLLVQNLLDQIMDGELRATLLLSYLYLHPLRQTHCCKSNFCFNCKCSGHHEKCDVNEIQVDDYLVQCCSCRIMILKVEYTPLLREGFGAYICWFKRVRSYAAFRDELFWKAYYKNHSGELEEQHEFEAALLKINL
uniref:Uncharacterized protein n=1 Tax=Globisporangium ultimum (strain ATCC 200006 / CBS 805.95 / DAOM BR144) TaxID=431595 RepID=K3X2S0_GLOUD